MIDRTEACNIKNQAPFVPEAQCQEQRFGSVVTYKQLLTISLIHIHHLRLSPSTRIKLYSSVKYSNDDLNSWPVLLIDHRTVHHPGKICRASLKGSSHRHPTYLWRFKRVVHYEYY